MTSRLPSGIDFEDLISAGNIGLCDAADKFDPARGTLFTTFAIHKIRGAILEALRAWDFYPRSARDQERAGGGHLSDPASLDDRVAGSGKWHAVDSRDGVTLRDAIPDDSPGPEAIVLRGAQISAVRSAVMQLPARERDVMLMRCADSTHLEIGKALGVSESRAYQICQAAMKRLRKVLREWQPDAM